MAIKQNNNLRSCKVRTPERKESLRTVYGEIRTKMIQEAEEYRGFFHGWHEKLWTIGESYLVGGHTAGQMSQLVGIVEDEEGKIHECLPEEITFITKREGKKAGWIPVTERLPEEPENGLTDVNNLAEYIVVIDGAEREQRH